MVSILFAMARIASDCLEMAFSYGADPDIPPRGRDRERPNAREHGRIADEAPIRCEISKAFSCADAANTRHAVGNVA